MGCTQVNRGEGGNPARAGGDVFRGLMPRVETMEPRRNTWHRLLDGAAAANRLEAKTVSTIPT